MSEKASELIATFFHIGYSPVAPGTVASFATIFIYLFLHDNPVVYLVLLFVTILLGLQASDDMEKSMDTKDPGCIVIDEVAGMLIALLFLPVTPMVLFVAFLMFRAFDILKIYPINCIEKIGGGSGIMYDDLVAGLFTNIIMQIAIRFSGIAF